jgi:squalene-hopene/tetraprenyl-beta-curcumene cyclase
MKNTWLACIAGGVLIFTHAAGQDTAAALPPSRLSSHSELSRKASEYLLRQQDAATGGWNVSKEGPQLPAITGLVVAGLVRSGQDPASAPIQAGIKFILQYQQTDGGIYDKMMPGYNTSICLTTLCLMPASPHTDSAKEAALKYLRSIQYGEDAVVRVSGTTQSVDGTGQPQAQPVDKSHPFYGGVGYGKHGRPDLSNTQFFVEALHAAGVPPDDPAMQRALVFLARVQMLEKVKSPDGKDITVNDMAYAKGSQQGGFVYATAENKDTVGSGQSFAGMMDESLSDGTTASRLRSYGSMSYAGFKSLLYAGLKRDDPRVTAAREWISRHYTLDENPGVGTDGQYYYYVVFAKALSAYGEPKLEVTSKDGTKRGANWRVELAEKLASLQEPDGSMKPLDDRWMEDNRVLITAYALNAMHSQ